MKNKNFFKVKETEMLVGKLCWNFGEWVCLRMPPTLNSMCQVPVFMRCGETGLNGVNDQTIYTATNHNWLVANIRTWPDCTLRNQPRCSNQYHTNNKIIKWQEPAKANSPPSYINNDIDTNLLPMSYCPKHEVLPGTLLRNSGREAHYCWTEN